MIDVRPMRDGESEFCERVLRALPAWFGIADAIVHYVDQTRELPTWIAELDGKGAGFLTLKQHSPDAAEIYCMGVLPEVHHRGVGRALVEFAAKHCRNDDIRFLQVKTQGPSRPCEAYDKTRQFYESIGFSWLEEFPDLWPGNPCLLMVMHIDGPR